LKSSRADEFKEVDEVAETGNNGYLGKILLPDEEEANPIPSGDYFDFDKYSEVLADIVERSNDKYSIGIYGEWGSGKTTLMKLIEKRLKPCVFVWNDIGCEKDNDTKADKELKDDLIAKFRVDWINDKHFRKTSNPPSIILDDKQSSNNSLSITLEDNKNYKRENDQKLAILRINHQKVAAFEATYETPGERLVVRQNDILPVWFNAWRYESEQNYALIPLMKTIAYAMGDHPMYKDLKNTILKGLAILGKDLLRHYAVQNFMTEKGVQEFEDTFTKKFSQSVEFERDVIYFDGIKKIGDTMKDLILKKPNTKIVVFIDDLDRCSPNKALEVFESVKVFFDMTGFVFIMGLSQEALNRIIRAKFQTMGLSGITPEQYIRKIIQVEVQIGKWTEDRIGELIKMISDNLDQHLKCKVATSTDLIKEIVLERDQRAGGRPRIGNPREVKRFINKFLVFLQANENNIPLSDYKKYLIVQALNKNWKNFYQNFFDSRLRSEISSYNSSFPQRVKEWMKLGQEQREEFLKLVSEKRQGPYLTAREKSPEEDEAFTNDPFWSSFTRPNHLDKKEAKRLFNQEPFWREVIATKLEFMDPDLWQFLDHNQNKLFEEDLKNYKSFIESSDVVITTPQVRIDMDLVSRRRNSYLDLWPRFKLLISDFQDVEKRYRGRSFTETYQDVQELFEKLQNWYFDKSGRLLMSDSTLNSFYVLQREMHKVLRKVTEGKESGAKLSPLSPDELKTIRYRVSELCNNLSKDIIGDPLQ